MPLDDPRAAIHISLMAACPSSNALDLMMEMLRSDAGTIPSSTTTVPNIIKEMTRDDWQIFYLMVLRAGLPGLFLERCTAHGGDRASMVPPAILSALKTLHITTTYKNLVLRDAYTELSTTLSSREIGHVPLKGIECVFSLYPDPGWRTLADIDILVCEDDLERIDEIMCSLWYKGESSTSRRKNRLSHFHHMYTRMVEGVPVHVEVHWNLSALIGSRTYIIACSPVRRLLSPTHNLVYLVLHAASHFYLISAKWLVDIHRFSRMNHDRIDWNEVRPLVERLRCRMPFLFALAALESLLSCTLPDMGLDRRTLEEMKSITSPDLFLSPRPLGSIGYINPLTSVFLSDDLGTIIRRTLRIASRKAFLALNPT